MLHAVRDIDLSKSTEGEDFWYLFCIEWVQELAAERVESYHHARRKFMHFTSCWSKNLTGAIILRIELLRG